MRRVLFSILMTMLVCPLVFGQDGGRSGSEVLQEEVDGVTWYYKLKIVRDVQSRVPVTNAMITVAGEDKYMGDLVIPSKLGGFTVTAIDGSAFSGCSALTSLRLPNTITSVGAYAFSGCSFLLSVNLPVGLTEIDQGTFSGCKTLAHIEIPSTVKRIGDRAFRNCSSLTDMVIPEGVESVVGIDTFGNCSALKNVIIPSTMKKVECGFAGLHSLTNVVISEGVQEIPGYTFSSCSSLECLNVPSSVTSIGYGITHVCSTLKTLTVAKENRNYKSVNDCIVSANGKVLIAVPFGCAKVTVPEGVKEVPRGIFSGDRQLTDIVLPDSIENIAPSSFEGCTGLTSIRIPKNVKVIGEAAFMGCWALREVKFLGKVPLGVDISGLPSEAEQAKRKSEFELAEKRKAVEAERAKVEAEAAEKRKLEEVVRKKAEAEAMAEKQRKYDAALAELSGWPMPMSRIPNLNLYLYGTNNEEVLCDYASTAINRLGGQGECISMMLECEAHCPVVFAFANRTTNSCVRSWAMGSGKSLIDKNDLSRSIGLTWKKYDETGRMVKWANYKEFDEYIWMTNRHAAISSAMREKWAKKHGLTLEQATKRAAELILQIENLPVGTGSRSGALSRPVRPSASAGGLGSLRERRMARMQERDANAKAEAENQAKRESEQKEREAREAEDKAQREQEREQQQAQQIQYELKKAREARSAVEQ